MFRLRVAEALADLFDDMVDARELRGEQLARDAKQAWSLFLSQFGQLCLEEGRRIRSLLTRYPLRVPGERQVCGIRKNTSDRGWMMCKREPAHPGDCDFVAPTEQDVISVHYDD